MIPDEIVKFVEDDLSGTMVIVASETNGLRKSPGEIPSSFTTPTAPSSGAAFPYATVVNNNVPGFDEESNPGRDGVFRVNIWVSRPTFEHEAESDRVEIDYTVLDRVIPHPVYGPQSWLSVLNPTDSTRDKVKNLLTEAHSRARDRYNKKFK